MYSRDTGRGNSGEGGGGGGASLLFEGRAAPRRAGRGAAAGRGDNTAGGTGGCGAALPPARRPRARGPVRDALFARRGA